MSLGRPWESGAAGAAALEPAFRTRLTLGALATWRLAHLLAREDGPADVVVRLRSRADDGALGRWMDCFQCVSVWVAAPVALIVARTRRDAVLTWLALSGAACLLDRATGDAGPSPPAVQSPGGEA